MAQIKLLVDFPNLPAGTILTQDVDGVYKDGAGKLNLSQAFVDSRPTLVDTVNLLVASTTTYYYINDTGAIKTKVWANDIVDQAHKTFGNIFATSDLATTVRNLLVPIYRDQQHGFN